MKRILTLLLTAALALALCACGDNSPAEIDGAKLSAELRESGCFSTDLDELPASKADVFYTLDESKLAGAVMYHAAGTSKEQLAVFTAVDEDAAGDIVAVLQGLTAEWIEADRDYAPDEVPKLERAILRQSGVYVVYVVAADADAAGKLADKYF